MSDCHFSEVLGDVVYIKYGPFSERFKNYDRKNGTPWLCFSLHYPHRTIDIECSDDSQVCVVSRGINLYSTLFVCVLI